MTGVSWVAAAATAGVLVLLAPPRATLHAVRPARAASDRAVLLRLRPVLVPMSFVGAWTFVGGVPGVVVGTVVAIVAWRVLGRTESPSARRRREELERDLPIAVHLLGACLEAGAATSTALASVCAALPGAVAEELRPVHHQLTLGADPLAAWRDLAMHPQLGPLGRAMARAHRSGASVRDAIAGLAVELAAQSRIRTEALARSVEVRAAAPLGACFLPAFLLLGVVPMVAGVFSAMRIFG